MRLLTKGILLLLVGLFGLAQTTFAGVVITDINCVWSTTTYPDSNTISWTAGLTPPDTRATYTVYRKFGGPESTYPWIQVAPNLSSTTYKDNCGYGTYSYQVVGTGDQGGEDTSGIVTSNFIHDMKRCDGNGEQLGMSQVWNFKYKLQEDAYMTIRIFRPGATPVYDTYGFVGSELSIPATVLPGTLVKTLTNRVARSFEMADSSWKNKETWDCRDDTGKIVPNGIYWILFEAVVDQDPGDIVGPADKAAGGEIFRSISSGS